MICIVNYGFEELLLFNYNSHCHHHSMCRECQKHSDFSKSELKQLAHEISLSNDYSSLGSLFSKDFDKNSHIWLKIVGRQYLLESRANNDTC